MEGGARPMRHPVAPAAAAALLALVALAGCSGGDGGPSATPSSSEDSSTWRTPEPITFRLSSSAFRNGHPIPARHTCDGAEASPPLTFMGAPKGAKSLALTVKDHDVPTPEAPASTIDHWVVWNVTASSSVTFPEGRVPAGAAEGANTFGRGWLGPCPPEGSSPHRYNFTAYALDRKPALRENATAAELEAAMEGHVLAQATLIGTYQRPLNLTGSGSSTGPSP